MILLIDNYDSFVHNLARYFRLLGCETRVVRNDQIDVQAARRLAPEAIVFSPGPCTPDEAGASLDLATRLHEEVPMLGVCLGHQTLAVALGGRVALSPKPTHGRASRVHHDGEGVFADLPSPLQVGRYHSLIVDRASLPAELVLSALTDDELVMAVRHVSLPVVGVQFHPESVLTEGGHRLVSNFVRIARAVKQDGVTKGV